MVSPAFLRISALCWMVSAATTLGLIFLPRLVAPAADFESQVRLAHDPAYLLRLAISIVHPLIVLVGALGVLVLRAPYAFGSSTVGFVFYFLWASVEAVQQCLTLVALNFEFAYSIPLRRQPCRVYLGGGPAANIYSFDDRHGGGTDVEPGFNILIGVQHTKGLFAEFKIGTIDSPDIKFTVGYVFR